MENLIPEKRIIQKTNEIEIVFWRTDLRCNQDSAIHLTKNRHKTLCGNKIPYNGKFENWNKNKKVLCKRCARVS